MAELFFQLEMALVTEVLQGASSFGSTFDSRNDFSSAENAEKVE